MNAFCLIDIAAFLLAGGLIVFLFSFVREAGGLPAASDYGNKSLTTDH